MEPCNEASCTHSLFSNDSSLRKTRRTNAQKPLLLATALLIVNTPPPLSPPLLATAVNTRPPLPPLLATAVAVPES